mmetsp:Transcript_13855/g.24272  ORF Transcript_13855/g.24272 Transcript_13855/m.24272 type:complete len:303 (-) Transcript_13855:486-1394(-)|eukprot:CAMPEP_0119104776 /NCGR_PEP_ID=MMETSP1180-20130426/2905_1 /TAXON_ID=3052 ORGANISM="Chlamydomonas cf sp, Strain CCMP681" /NCGR_SAMPLE_ID=MMETSP1180 /ASSEMBLY_ACC=CAM_ASM_000741 /LENGTH=302 /DNA_ID=CAMNT_0007089611 /DNA_START=60 /DNA_END=968 /DNA_ORIENTATION=+
MTRTKSKLNGQGEKLLWKKPTGGCDNAMDNCFLSNLVVNAHVPTRRYWAVALDAAAVSQQVSVAMASVVLPIQLHLGLVTVQQLLLLDVLLLVAGYAACQLLGGHVLGGSLKRGLRQGVLLVGGVFFLSPVLRTLAATISTDSIVCLTIIALLLHLFLHDYNFVNSVTARLSGAVSLSSAMMAAVLVASLMPSDLHVFAQVLFALELYLLSPFVRRYVRVASLAAHVGVTVAMALATAGLLGVTAGVPATLVYIGAHLGVAFACPAVLIRIHKFKAKISGPWDEAVPHLSEELCLSALPDSR